MRADQENDPLRRHLRAALDGLSTAVEDADPVTPALVHEVLEHIGDAVRASLSIPVALKRWVEARQAAEIIAALHATQQEAASWSLPASADDDTLAFLMLRRDAAESLLTAVTRWGIPHGTAPGELADVALLADTLSAFDQQLAALVSRPVAESLLGERAPLVGVNGWTSLLPEPEEAASASVDLDWDPAMVDVAPSDEVVTEYITGGRLARFVEGFARKEDSFAVELDQLVRGAIDDGDASFVARRWIRQYRRDAAPIRYPVLPRQEFAASTPTTAPAPSFRVELGQLTTQSQGLLVATTKEVTLEVYAPSGRLDRVELGGVLATSAPSAGGTTKWTATIPRPSGAVGLRIVASDGEIIDDEITLVAVEPS